MTKYLEGKPFTVPIGKRDPDKCDHAEPWLDKWGRCVQCGTEIKPLTEDAA